MLGEAGRRAGACGFVGEITGGRGEDDGQGCFCLVKGLVLRVPAVGWELLHLPGRGGQGQCRRLGAASTHTDQLAALVLFLVTFLCSADYLWAFCLWKDMGTCCEERVGLVCRRPTPAARKAQRRAQRWSP